MKAAGEGAKAIVYIGTAGLSCGIAPNTCACNQVTCHGDGPNMTITVHGTGNFTGINYVRATPNAATKTVEWRDSDTSGSLLRAMLTVFHPPLAGDEGCSREQPRRL